MTVIAGAAQQFDRLVVAVASNPQKQAGLFTVAERVQMLTAACRDYQNVSVVSRYGLVVEIAGRVGAEVLVRGGGKEHVDEKQMAYMNGCQGLPTVLVPTDPATAFISSSQVRALIAMSAIDPLSRMVPTSVTTAAEQRAS